MVGVQPFRYALVTNATTTTYAVLVVTTTEPTGTGVFDMGLVANGVGDLTQVPSYIELVPYGVGADTKTFNMRVTGFNATNDATKIYVPQLITEITCTLSGVITGTPLIASALMVDTIVVNKGPIDNGVWRSFTSPANDTAASLILHTRGCRYLTFDFDIDAGGGSAVTNANCLWRPFDF